LRSARSDDVTLAQPISGVGSVEQDGGGIGRLILQGGNKTYSGHTAVLKGGLATVGSEDLPDASDITVAAGATLTIAGTETVKSLLADGAVAITSRLTTTGDMTFNGALTATGSSLSLTGQRILAVNDGNRWGSGNLSLDAAGVLTLKSGLKDPAGTSGLRDDLKLGTVKAGAGGAIDAGVITLDGNLTVQGSTLTLTSLAPAAFTTPGSDPLAPDLVGKRTPADRQIAFAADVVVQTVNSTITVVDGAQLAVVASQAGALIGVPSQGGSVKLLSPGNLFAGGLVVRSGDAQSPWAAKLVTDTAGGASLQYSLQSQVRVAGTSVTVVGAGIEADVVAVAADRLTTPGDAKIVARLPFDNLTGTVSSVPALALTLNAPAFSLDSPFGLGSQQIAIDVGSKAWGPRTALPVDGGYVTVLPVVGINGRTAIFLKGPAVAGTYGFFYGGAGLQTAVPLFYNGVSAVTPQVSGSISATVSVSESARRERFEEAVRTENVAGRMRAGVIAEVGPGRPATVSTEGSLPPPGCAPAAGLLACAAAGPTPKP
jgi:hypothetical protein